MLREQPSKGKKTKKKKSETMSLFSLNFLFVLENTIVLNFKYIIYVHLKLVFKIIFK